jgi:acyl carrier protein
MSDLDGMRRPTAPAADDLDDEALRAFIRTELRAIRPGKLPNDWSDEARYREELGLDSLDFVEMIARLEQLTGIYVPDVDMPKLTSIATTADYVRRRRGA